MQKIISLKSISVTIVSPQKQKRIGAHKSSDFSRHSQQSFLPPSTQSDILPINDDEMPILVSNTLRSWLECNYRQGFLKVAEAEPHPRVEALMEEIDVSKITNKKVREPLGMPRRAFDTVKRVSVEGLRSYFGEYLPSTKAYQTRR